MSEPLIAIARLILSTDALRDWACEPGDDGVSLRERLRAAVEAVVQPAEAYFSEPDADEPDEARPQLYRDVAAVKPQHAGTPHLPPGGPLREALRAITGAEPPEWIGDAHSCHDLGEEKWDALQAWCATHARPAWATGIGILEAAELIVGEAVANGNLRVKP